MPGTADGSSPYSLIVSKRTARARSRPVGAPERRGPTLPSVLGPPVQIAYTTDDARAAAHAFAEHHGAGPFVVIDRIELEWGEVGGDPCDFVHTSAYGWWGEVMVEFVQPDSPAPSPFHPPYGPASGGLHHVAVMVEDLTATLSWCADQGMAIAARARTASTTGDGTEFAFVDTRPTLGHLTEIYERSDRLTGFYDHVRSLSIEGV